jgi:hypothetical protein
MNVVKRSIAAGHRGLLRHREHADVLGAHVVPGELGGGGGIKPARMAIAKVRSIAGSRASFSKRSITGPSWISFSSSRFRISRSFLGCTPSIWEIIRKRSSK